MRDVSPQPSLPPANLSSRASTTFAPVRVSSHTWKYNTRGVSDNCISRLVTALGGGAISVTLCAVVLQPRELRSFVPECYLGAFNRKGGARGRFRRNWRAGERTDFKSALYARKLNRLIRVTNAKLEHLRFALD